jgi:hypothetical protein
MAHSSSVLVSVKNRFFLVGAAHSFFDVDIGKDIRIMIDNYSYELGGNLRYFEPNKNDGAYVPNNADMAVFELSNGFVRSIEKKYNFLPWSRIVFGHESSKDARYFLQGYPEKITGTDFPTYKIHSSAFNLAAIGFEKDFYMEENIDSRKVIAVTADQSVWRKMPVINQGEVKLSELGGISGSGVWNVFNLESETPEYRLVSIVTGENHAKTCLYSTRIEVLRAILIEKFNVEDIDI